MSYLEVVASSIFFQFSLYACVRLAHRGFTFGELGLVAFGATVLFMELMNMTSAKVGTVNRELEAGMMPGPPMEGDDLRAGPKEVQAG